ncbi:MAG: LysR family transcriptional regulator [Actinomycetota bacterium]
MRHATFHQLRVFDAIVRHGSFTRAAEEMNLTQPTLSMQVRKIGSSLGLPLFEQIGKRIHLTEAGQALHGFCREVFAAIDRLDAQVAALKGLEAGRLRLCAISTAESFLPRLIGPFCNLHPGLDVALTLQNRERVLERLKANADDLYVFGQPPDEPEVEAVRFLENPLVVAAPEGHALAGRRKVALAELAGQPFLVREPGSGTRSAMERRFAEAGLQPRLRMELGSNEAMRQAVLGGLGLAVMSAHAIAGVPGLTALDVEGFPIRRHWYLVRLPGKRLSPAARALCRHFAGEGAPELAAWGA